MNYHKIVILAGGFTTMNNYYTISVLLLLPVAMTAIYHSNADVSKVEQQFGFLPMNIINFTWLAYDLVPQQGMRLV